MPKIHADPTQPSPAQETCVSFVFLLHCFPHRRLSKCGTQRIKIPHHLSSLAESQSGGCRWTGRPCQEMLCRGRRLNDSHTTAASDCTKQKCDLAESRMKQAQIRVLVLVLVLVLGTALCSLIASCKRVQSVRYSEVLHAIAAS